MSLRKNKPYIILSSVVALAAGGWLIKSHFGSSTSSSVLSTLHPTSGSAHSADAHADCGNHCQHNHPKTELIRQSFEKTGGDAITKLFPDATVADFWKGLSLQKPILAREALIAKKGDKVSLQLGVDSAAEAVLIARNHRKDGAQVFSMEVPETGFHLHYIEMTDGRLIGSISRTKHPVTYRIAGTIQEPLITAVAAVNDYCSEWSDERGEIIQGIPVRGEGNAQNAPVTNVAKLDSNIGSANVIYLDFDGEEVTGTRWNDVDNPTISAAPTTYSEQQIALIWDAVAEDFRSFDVNVTTDRQVFDDAEIGSRMMVIFTPTNTAAPGAGGVAFLGSFYDGSDDPCWTFNQGVSVAALTASHEVGHTLDLLHDGRINPAEEYYGGNNVWGPIMGAPFDSPVSHWSKGEYPSANNQEDDIAIISDTLDILDDTVGDDTFSAEALATDEDGNFAITGMIETQADRDVYSFDTSGGFVTINATAAGPEGDNGQNLNIRLSIVDAGGGLIVESNDTATLSTSISANIVGGSYYLIVEGAGEATWLTGGYGDYSSIGGFSVSGNLPPPTPGDFDGDGLSDDEELALGTDPYDRDTDGDGLSDRQEVYPFSIVSGQYTYSSALIDALNAGGNLAVIDSPQKLYRVKRGLLTTALPSPIPANYDPLVDIAQRLWLGGSDSTEDGLFQWVTPVGDLNGAEIGSAFLANVEPGSSTLTNVVNVSSLTVGRRLQGSGLPGPVTITAIDTAARTVTLSSPVNAALNQGVASVIIQNPGTGFTTPPTISFNPPGATATATVALGRITSITVNNPGTYTVPPTVTIRGSSGAGASALAVLTPASTLARVISIEVTNGGTGYTTPPEVVINGVGQGALAEANIDDTTGVVTGVTLLNSGLGYTTAPTITLVGGGGNNATAIAKIADPAMRLYSPATPNTYSRWSGGLLPGNRLNVAEGVALNSGTEFLWSTTQVTTGLGYLLERPVTNPRVADTDGDGIADLLEFEEYGTNPSVADSDGDGVSDPDELFVHKSNPKLVDTDGDGLSDGQEVIGSIGGFKSNPLVVDSDGDLVSDFDEVNANPATNPLDSTSTPQGIIVTSSGLQDTATFRGQSELGLSLSYAPFGHRPDTDKTGDDGSVALRDRNGAIIWIDNSGRSIVVPDSSLARTLYVSNSECVMYNNRYDGSYDARNSTSTVLIHRRASDGTIVTSLPIVIPGTIVDTAPISPTTYGFTLVAGRSFDDNFQESTERFQSGTTQQGAPIFSLRSLNYWDVCNYTMYRITWDAQVQTLGAAQLDVVPGAPNLGSTRVIATGSDGSFVFNRVVAQNFYRDLPNGGYFNSETASYWTSFNLNSENIGRVSLRFQPEVENVGYLSNTRALLEFPIVVQDGLDPNLNPVYTETGNYELQDMRQRSNGVTTTVNTFPLDLGDKLLPVTPYTRSGLIPYVYTISALRTAVKFYRVDATLARLGAAINLPDPVLDDTDAIRNAWDGSLLLKSEGQSGLLWLASYQNPTTKRIERLLDARSITASTLAKPLFVDRLQAVAWLNFDAPVNLSSGAQVPTAVINHYKVGNGNTVILTPLTPPIEGRYVAFPPLITPEAIEEGWYITTFEKSGDRSSLVRSYRLGAAAISDRDRDGLPDALELRQINNLPGLSSLGGSFFTDSSDPDSDDDGLSDGDEYAPYYVISGQFTWLEAQLDAKRRGGRLAVFRNRNDYLSAVFRFQGQAVGNLWIGATDSISESNWLWEDGATVLNETTWLSSENVWVNFRTEFGKDSVPWLQGRPNNLNDSDYLVLTNKFQFEDRPGNERRSYLIEYGRTYPNSGGDPKLAVDSDEDGLSDYDEINTYLSGPSKKDTDGDGILDNLEVNGYVLVDGLFKASATGTKTNPSKADTDGDEVTDSQEMLGYGWVVIGNVGRFVAGAPPARTSDPNMIDTDGDGYRDGFEVSNGFYVPKTENDKPWAFIEGSDPNSRVSIPTAEVTLGMESGKMLNQVELVQQHPDVTIQQQYSPFGNRTDFNKYGDDGSGIHMDVNGMLLWKDQYGNVRTLKESQYAVPLLVSSTECVVWLNAFDPQRFINPPAGLPQDPTRFDGGLQVRMYRYNSKKNVVEDSPIVFLQGDVILNTAPITTRTQAYTLVTLGDGGVGRVYRFTYLPITETREEEPGELPQPLNVQQIAEIGLPDGLSSTDLSRTRVLGHGTDGSIVFSILSSHDPAYHGDLPFDYDGLWPSLYWVNASAQNHTSVWERIGKNLSGITSLYYRIGDRTFTPFDTGLHPKVHYTSTRRVLFQLPRVVGIQLPTPAASYDQHGEFWESVRNINTGELSSDRVFGNWIGRRFLNATTLTVEGKYKWLYEYDGDIISAWRVSVTEPEFVYRANVTPSGSVTDTSSVVKVDLDDGSAAIQSDSIGLAWLANNNESNSPIGTTYPNFITIPNSRNSIPLYVDKSNFIAWGSGLDTVTNVGGMRPADLRHYGQENGAILQVGQDGFINLSSRISGRYIMATPPYTPDPSLWLFTTAESVNAEILRMHTYRFTSITDLDSDADGIPDILEFNNLSIYPVPTPGSIPPAVQTSPFDADLDKDGLSDGDEYYPYYVIRGAYTWADAKADAIARGGKLAIIDTRDKYAALVKRLSRNRIDDLWLGANDVSSEGVFVWQDSKRSAPDNILNAANWQKNSDYWSRYQTQLSFRIPWSANKPDNFNNADGLALKATTMLFEDRVLSQKLGYLIEFNRTNPANPDSDGDGISDGDEVNNGTNPVAANPFAFNVSEEDITNESVISILRNARSSKFAVFSGRYDGHIFDSEGNTHLISLNLSNNGAFSSSLNGLENAIRGSFRGQFADNSSIMIEPGSAVVRAANSIGGLRELKLWLTVSAEPDNHYIIKGTGITVTGTKLGIELRRPLYVNSLRYENPGRVTVLVPLPDSLDSATAGQDSAIVGPKGDAVATGTINARGRMALSIYMPDGGRASFAGTIVEGNYIPFRALSTTKGTSSILLGPVDMKDENDDRDFGGSLRYYSPAGVLGSQHQEGYSQKRTVSGAFYMVPQAGFMPLNGYQTIQNNVVFNMIGGDFAGISKVATWSVSNKITMPAVFGDIATARFNATLGLLSYKQTLTDIERDLRNANATAFGIYQQRASQKRGTAVLRGFYESDFASGKFDTVPNDGRRPELTVISPTSGSLKRAGGVYSVRVDAITPLIKPDNAGIAVQIPAGVSWVTVTSVTDDRNGQELKGRLTGTVTITVAPNDTFFSREVTIFIEGVPHTINQDYRAQ